MAAEGPQQIAVPGQGAGWLKRYQGGARRWRLALLNGVVRLLRVPALQASPPRPGDDLRQLEQRRLEALAAKGVHVPTILRSGPGELLLSDLGPTLAARLLAGDTAERLRLLGETALAIAAVHRRQVCLGQPLGRNITVDDAGRIGFLDFEDDPLEVMTLAQAQCRDWLFLAAGSLRHARSVPTAELSRALSLGLIQAQPAVRAELAQSLRRLGWLGWISARLGRRARGLTVAIDGLLGALAQTPADESSNQASGLRTL